MSESCALGPTLSSMLRPNLRWIDFEAAIAGTVRDRMAICQGAWGMHRNIHP